VMVVTSNKDQLTALLGKRLYIGCGNKEGR
jgi:hypothetical protein